MARILRSRSVPVAIAAALVLVAVVGLSIGQAEPGPNLPDVAPAELIASTLSAIAERTPVSGTVTTHLDLGLPQLPSSLGGATGVAGVLSADQTFKEWRSPDGVRVAQILPLAERDIVASPTDLWYWDSDLNTAWHLPVPADAQMPQPPSPGDLQAITDNVLAAVEPYARVSIADPTVVAGRDAYVLRIAPVAQHTLVGHIDIAIDSQARLPLRLQVFAKGSADASISIGFTSVEFSPVDPSMFSFTPPQGATVKEIAAAPAGSVEPAAGGAPEVRTFGKGFDLILAVRVAEVPKDLRSLLPYAGALGSADLVELGDHAWIVAGAVAPDALAEVESRLP